MSLDCCPAATGAENLPTVVLVIVTIFAILSIAHGAIVGYRFISLVKGQQNGNAGSEAYVERIHLVASPAGFVASPDNTTVTPFSTVNV